jgi:hypothetical protein
VELWPRKERKKGEEKGKIKREGKRKEGKRKYK